MTRLITTEGVAGDTVTPPAEQGDGAIGWHAPGPVRSAR